MRAIEAANPEKPYGIFGHAQWTNKECLSDDTLRDPIEHFSTNALDCCPNWCPRAHSPIQCLPRLHRVRVRAFLDDWVLAELGDQR